MISQSRLSSNEPKGRNSNAFTIPHVARAFFVTQVRLDPFYPPKATKIKHSPIYLKKSKIFRGGHQSS